MREEQMELYICTRCNLLLTRIDAKYVQYESATLSESGEYEPGDGIDSEFDYYLCPICSGLSVDRKEIPEKATLEVKLFSLPTIKAIVALRRSLFELQIKSKAEDAYLYEVGIPLDTPGLKEMLLEELLT